jgi:ribosomal protein S18 acetylase RimI-like enzyme
MQIRPMQPDELDEVMDLHIEGLESELKLYSQILPGRSVNEGGRGYLKKILLQMIQNNECFFTVAEEVDTLVGYCLVTKKMYPVENPRICGCINGIYLKDSARRQGVGTKLYNLAVKWLKKQNVHFVELYHMSNDPRAKAFWERMGYVKVQDNCAKVL